MFPRSKFPVASRISSAVNSLQGGNTSVLSLRLSSLVLRLMVSCPPRYPLSVVDPSRSLGVDFHGLELMALEPPGLRAGEEEERQGKVLIALAPPGLRGGI